MTTAAQARREARRIRAELERDARRKDRERLRALRTAIREQKARRTARRKEIVTYCRRWRVAATAKAKRLRLQAIEAAQRAAVTLRNEARARCETAKRKAKKGSQDAIAQAMRALAAERDYQSEVLASIRKRKPAGRVATAERRRESDDEVRGSIDDPQLLPVWDRVKHRIRATPRMTRLEAFMQWVHDHSAEVLEIIDQENERAVARLVAEEQRLARDMRRPAKTRHRKRTDEELRAYLAGVPF